MKRLVILMLMIASTTAIFAQKAKQGTSKKGSSTIAAASYTCPMHPEVTSHKSGKCPKCGMDLNLSKKEQMKAEVTHTYTCPMHPDVVSNNPGNCPQCKSKLVVDRRGSKQAATVYTCEMHPDVASATAGKCPICGMQMVAKKSKKD